MKKRIISLLLMLCLAAAMFPAANAATYVSAAVPSGAVDMADYDNNSSASVFKISSSSGMLKFSQAGQTNNFSGKTIYLACDLNMSGISYQPIASFAGTFDGGFHVLKNLTISASEICCGVFAKTTSSAVIKNFGVVGGTITGSCSSDGHRVGSIVGQMSGGLIECCWSTATVNAKQASTSVTEDLSAGGLVGGLINNATAKNCYFAGIVNGVAHASGISDWCQGQNSGAVGKIINCYNYGTLNATTAYGLGRYSSSILDENKSAAITNSYYLKGSSTYDWATGATAVTEASFGLGSMAYKLDNGGTSSRTRVWSQGELFPELRGTCGVYKLTLTINAGGASTTSVIYRNAGGKYTLGLPDSVSPVITSSTATISGKTLTMPAADTAAAITTSAPNVTTCSTNTSSSVYVLTSPEGFTAMATAVNAAKNIFKSKSVYMLNDVNMSGISNYTPIGVYISDSDWTKAFQGSFYGNDFRVFNLKSSTSLNGAGLFGVAYGANIQHLGVYNGTVKGANRVGGIAGYGDKTTFSYCFNGAAVSATGGDDGCGGIAGVSRSSSVLNYCFNFGTITSAGEAAAGLSGWGQANVKVNSCYNVGKVTSAGTPEAFVRTKDSYSPTDSGCYYLSSAAKSTVGGNSIAFNTFESGAAAYNLNTKAGTAANAKAFTSTPLYPAICTENSSYASKLAVKGYDGSIYVGTHTIYANVGDTVGTTGSVGYYYAEGVIVAASETVTIKLESVKYKLTYNYNGGSFEGTASDYANYTVMAGKELPDGKLVKKDGYEFAGWYTASGLSGSPLTAITPGTTGNKTLYAKWSTLVSIKTAAQYRSFVSAVNGGDAYAAKYVRLENDIDLGSTSVPSAGTSAKPFSGVFDGNGYTVTNLKISGGVDQGMIGYLKNGIVKNVIVSGGTVTGTKNAGTIVGTNNGGVVLNCGADSTVTASTASQFTLMSFNIRVPNDDSPNSLSDRTPRVKTYLSNYSPDIVGFQEVTPGWATVLNSALSAYNKEFKYRAASSSEGTPLYWKKSKFDALEQGTFWLSETPDKESKGWGSSYYRICSYAVLKIKNTQRIILAYNTHLDVEKAEARLGGANLILSRIAAMRKKYEGQGYTQIAAYVTGDFNCKSGSDPYKAFAAKMKDAKTVAIDLQSPLTQPTFNGFTGTSTSIIDFIFADPELDILTFKVTSEKINGGYVSDHYGLFSTIGFGDRGCGGIVGNNTGTVINAYFKGVTNGYSASGGVVGVNGGYVMNSYFAGTIGSAAKSSGGVSGYNTGTVKNCYCISGLSNNGGGTAKTAEAMQSASFASTLNYATSEWKYFSGVNGGYPYFRSSEHNTKLTLVSSSDYSLQNETVTKVKGNTTVASFIAEFVNTGLSVNDGNADKPATGLVATGDRIVLKDGDTILDAAYIIVAGDTDSDGKVTQNDYVKVKASFKKNASLDTFQTVAADINKDGNLTVTDYIMLKRLVSGTYVI